MSISRKNPRKNKPPKQKEGTEKVSYGESNQSVQRTMDAGTSSKEPRKLPSLKEALQREKSAKEAQRDDLRQSLKRKIAILKAGRKVSPCLSFETLQRLQNQNSNALVPVGRNSNNNNKTRPKRKIFKNLRLRKKVNNESEKIVTPECIEKEIDNDSNGNGDKFRKFKSFFTKKSRCKKASPLGPQNVASLSPCESNPIEQGEDSKRRVDDEFIKKLLCCSRYGQIVNSIGKLQPPVEGIDVPPETSYNLRVDAVTPLSNSSCSIKFAVTPSSSNGDCAQKEVNEDSDQHEFSIKMLLPYAKKKVTNWKIVKFLRKFQRAEVTKELPEPVITVSKPNGVAFEIEAAQHPKRCCTPMPVEMLERLGKGRLSLAEINRKQLVAAEKKLNLQRSKTRPQTARKMHVGVRKLNLEAMETERQHALQAHLKLREQKVNTKKTRKEHARLKKFEAQNRHADDVRLQKIIKEEKVDFEKKEKLVQVQKNIEIVNVRKEDYMTSLVHRLHDRNTKIAIKAHHRKYDIKHLDEVAVCAFSGIQPRNETEPLKPVTPDIDDGEIPSSKVSQ